MYILDAIIILIILAGAAQGFKNGFTKQLISFVGLLLVIVLSFMLKNYVSVFFYEYLPFFDFGGALKGVSSINIIIYEVLAFIVVFSVLMVIFRLVLSISTIFEKILNFTIILGIPSKILGAIVGAIESFIFVFIFLYVVSLPMVNFEGLEQSQFKNDILNSTPILSNAMEDTIVVLEEFEILKDKYENGTSTEQFNRDTLELLLKYNIISTNSVEKLVEQDKITITNIEQLLEQYKED